MQRSWGPLPVLRTTVQRSARPPLSSQPRKLRSITLHKAEERPISWTHRGVVAKIWGNSNSKRYVVSKAELKAAFPDVVIRKVNRKVQGAAGTFFGSYFFPVVLRFTVVLFSVVLLSSFSASTLFAFFCFSAFLLFCFSAFHVKLNTLRIDQGYSSRLQKEWGPVTKTAESCALSFAPSCPKPFLQLSLLVLCRCLLWGRSRPC